MNVALSEVCTFLNGGTPSKSVPSYFDGTIPWISSADISDSEVKVIRSYITEEAVQKSATNLVPAGTVLLVTRTGVGKVAIAPFSLCFSQDITAVVADAERLDRRYLMRFFACQEELLKRKARGATIQGVTRDVVEGLRIPLPSLEEQRRIAAILDKADALRQKRRTALQKLDSLTQSIFLDMFGDPVRNPNKWPQKRLEEITTKITDGEHLNPPFEAVGMPIIMAGNVMENSIDISSAKRVDVALGKRFKRKCNPEPGDLLVVSRGATIGRMCRLENHEEFCLMGSVILIKPTKQLIDANFLSAFLKHPAMRMELYKTSGSSAQQAIYLKDLKKMKCLIPPLGRQVEFSERLSAISKRMLTNQVSAQKMDRLSASLQSRAFGGEL